MTDWHVGDFVTVEMPVTGGIEYVHGYIDQVSLYDPPEFGIMGEQHAPV
jgi:hypothetical protein